jgi:flagellar motility protein MotE (MotC chaperone)
MAEELNLEIEEGSKPPKPKKKFVPLLAAFVAVWVLAAVGNYFYLKATYTPPPPPPAPEVKKPVTTIDLSGVTGINPAESSESDSTATHELENSPRIDSLRAAIADLTTASATRDSLIRTLAAAMQEKKQPEVLAKVTPQKTTADSAEVKRSIKLAKIVEAMQPTDAAKMLEPLPDNMVTYILLRLKQRQAAQIMAALPANRSAGISRAIMEPLMQ